MSLSDAMHRAGQGDLDRQLAAINQSLQAEYERMGIPAEERLFDTLQNTDTTEQSQADAVKARNILGGVDQRNNARFGVTARTPGEAKYQERSRSLGDVSAQAYAFGSAQENDRDTKMRTLQDLMNQGAGLRNNAVSGMGAAAQNEASRNQANQAASAQNRGQMMSLAGTALGFGAMALL